MPTVRTIVLLAALLAPLPVLAGPVPEKSARAQAGALLGQAVDRSHAGDHAAALALIAQAEAVIDAEPAASFSFQDVVARADMAKFHADELRLGAAGDPCPQLRKGRTLALQAQDMTANDGEVERREMAARLIVEIDGQLRKTACAAVPEGRVDPAFVGHYYLSGVRETGSELLLRAEGTFDWFISYGAVDQFARGRWASDGAAVILTTEQADRSKPLYAPLDIEPWSAQAEAELLRRRGEALEQEVMVRCPFLADATVSTAPAATMDAPAPPEPAAVLQQRADASRQQALAARARAEAAMREAMAAPSDAHSDAARSSLSAWQELRWQADRDARAAGQESPELADAALPASCTVPPQPDAARLPPERWTGGIGVRVFDLAAEQGARQVKALLHFADGHEERIETASRGLAILPGKQASPVTSVTLAADYAPGRDQTFPVAPTTSGILHFSIDARQIIAPPFDVLRLRIAGKALVPDSFGQGRYERAAGADRP
ncbi:MAG: hypothetical protein KGL44_10780 [Sphingomonadales bacterium]|nr:hypothetical protein [Sphingomonadales bacterium]